MTRQIIWLFAEKVFEVAGVEFIDENGGGPGVRLGKRRQKKSWAGELAAAGKRSSATGPRRCGYKKGSEETMYVGQPKPSSKSTLSVSLSPR